MLSKKLAFKNIAQSGFSKISQLNLASLWFRYSWLILGTSCLILGYLFIWQRGFYLDDYSSRLNFLLAKKRGSSLIDYNNQIYNGIFTSRGLAYLIFTTSAQVLADNQFLLRVIIAGLIGLSAFLLGWFIFRILKSITIAVISGFLFLMPVYAQEAILWTSNTWNTVGFIVVLAFLHCFWTAIIRPYKWQRWILPSTILAFSASLLGETLALVIIIFPPFAILLAHQLQTNKIWTIVKRTLVVGIAPYFFNLSSYLLFYVINPSLGNTRGGLTTENLGDRMNYFLKGADFLTISDYGKTLTYLAFDKGLETIIHSWKGWILLFLILEILPLFILFWKDSKSEYIQKYRVGWVLFFYGLSFGILTFFIPGILLKNQILEIRMLYYPYAGLVVMLSAFFWILSKYINWRIGRVFLTLSSFILILCTICMVGYCSFYRARSELNQRQINALLGTIPAKELPQNTVFVPYNLDERLFPTATNSSPINDNTASQMFTGIFETDWTTNAVLKFYYQRNDFYTITSNHWSGFTFSSTKDSTQLKIQGREVSSTQLFLFTYQDQRILPIENIVLSLQNGTSEVIPLTIAKQLSRKGISTIPKITVKENNPTFTVINP